MYSQFMMHGQKNIKLYIHTYILHEYIWGIGGIAPFIRNLCTRRGWLSALCPGPVTPGGKTPWCQLNRRARLCVRLCHGSNHDSSIRFVSCLLLFCLEILLRVDIMWRKGSAQLMGILRVCAAGQTEGHCVHKWIGSLA